VNDFIVLFFKEAMQALGDSRIDELSVCMAPSNAVNFTLRKGDRYVRRMQPIMETEQLRPNIAAIIFHYMMEELR